LDVVFDDAKAVANGGLVLPMALAGRLGLAGLVEENVHSGDAQVRANVGPKAMALVASALAGGDCIEDADVLRVRSEPCATCPFCSPAPSPVTNRAQRGRSR
jgi:hypothetical protein